MAVKLSRTVSQIAHLFVLYGLALCSELFPDDVLTPYTHHHGSRRFTRDVQDCKHVSWENETYEVFKLNIEKPQVAAQILTHKFADFVSDRSLPGNLTRYLRHTALGSIAYIDDPYYMLSVLEPGGKDGCKKTFFTTRRSSVRETASSRPNGCKVAVNAGYFKVSTGECLGNIVSDGHLIQTSNDEQNANFGIREDGSIVVGYLSDSEIWNTTNPFRQLVTGVVWLVRNGSSFVNESLQLECSSHEDTGRIDTFASVLSARTAVGHDIKGRVVIVQVDGQTHRRGVSLWQFAELLIAHGVINAINLDGGGSSTFVDDGTVTNYPSDHCWGDPKYRCERHVSTILCAHEAQCLEPLCNQHGSCDNSHCSCDPPWTGDTCDRLNCALTNCSNHGNCSEGECSCESGWMGPECNTSCPVNRYGPGCTSSCYCFGRSYCDNDTGACLCPPGYTGYGCWRDCPANKYGQDCAFNCSHRDCSDHGKCSPVNGTCLCATGWSGPACNASLEDDLDSLLEKQKLQPTQILTTPSNDSWSTPPSIQPSSTHLDRLHITSATVQSLGSSPKETPLEPNVLLGNPPEVARPPLENIHPLKDSPNTERPDPPLSHDHQVINQNTPPPTECPASSKTVLSVIIAVSLSSALLHVILCVWTHRTLYRQISKWFNRKIRPRLSRNPHKRRRRKRRRKQHFVPLTQQDSSSDCSI